MTIDPMTREIIIRTQDLSRHFGRGETIVRAVNEVSMDIYQGELVVIMGPSGSGKTTLLSMLGTLLKPTSGVILLHGIEVTALGEQRLPIIRAQHIGFVFQGFNLLDALTLEENILLPAGLLPGGVNAARERCNYLIEQLQLSHRRYARPPTLSGGEKQRVAIARALINRPPLILADEPTGNLDSEKGQEVMMILHNIVRDEACTVIMVTHDNRVEDVADRLLWLEDGKLRDRKTEKHSWVKDPVCGMRVDEWTAAVMSDYNGSRYVFCSSRCQQRFMEDPEHYVNRKD
ncbi:MAG: ATP-binding cassette domain-containing protein [Gammaproteobacteria bacterium]|nr:ATP-binding cassette domain-containing protein [Gammaproteobacteria bacterium]